MADEGFILPDDAFVQVLLLLHADELPPAVSPRVQALARPRRRAHAGNPRPAPGSSSSSSESASPKPLSSTARTGNAGTSGPTGAPAPRGSSTCSARATYISFGYHPTTGKYKVVHIPRGRRDGEAADAIQVLTVGDKSWREVPVPAPGASYSQSCEAVTVDGSTYWLTASSDRVTALDLADDRVTSFEAPPDRVAHGMQLTNVDERLGLALRVAGLETRVEVWVRESGGGEQPRWSQRYNLLIELQPLDGEELIMNLEESNGELTAFAYVETPEPPPSHKSVSRRRKS
ncbi:hypothetical protein ACP70R_017690 [Stipagrostis hirtigluma subsp. patula]